MALYRCMSGGGMSETTLWQATNAPNSSVTQANVTVTLNDDINNYKYLRFVSRAMGVSDPLESIIVSVEDFKHSTTDAASSENYSTFYLAGCWPWIRSVGYVSDTSVKFGTNRRVGTGSTYDRVLPQYIIGMK